MARSSLELRLSVARGPSAEMLVAVVVVVVAVVVVVVAAVVVVVVVVTLSFSTAMSHPPAGAEDPPIMLDLGG